MRAGNVRRYARMGSLTLLDFPRLCLQPGSPEYQNENLASRSTRNALTAVRPCLSRQRGMHHSDHTPKTCVGSPSSPIRCLSLGIYGQVDRFLELGVVTKSCSDPRHAERLWNIIKLAGDCSVSLVGRIFRRDAPVGIVMPIETPVDADNIATKEERVRIIYRLRELVAELHNKRIVHGDVKPQNLLLCADGLVRFCDFDCASIEGDGVVAPIYTYPYCSAVRARNPDVPMTHAEDMYAMALSMWHLYTGKLPFTSEEEPEADMDCTFAGFLPDMSAIDDPTIAALIEECLAAGPERADTLDSGQSIYCITTWFVFGRCKAEPAHRYSRLVHSRRCLRMRRGDGPCECPFVDPKVFMADLEPVCTRCNKEVEYSGLFDT